MNIHLQKNVPVLVSSRKTLEYSHFIFATNILEVMYYVHL